MYNKKSIKSKILLPILAVVGFTLVGCGNRGNNINHEPREIENVTFSPNDTFVSSDVLSLTNQQMLDRMIESPEAIFVLLDIVDTILLRDIVTLEDNHVNNLFNELVANVDDVDAWLQQFGFSNQEQLLNAIELQELRVEAVSHLINVTDEEIQEVYENWFANDDTVFEDYREMIYGMLVHEQASEIQFLELARIRNEAGLTIYNEALAASYDSYLAMIFSEVPVNTASGSYEVVASINGFEVGIGLFFEDLLYHFGLEVAFMEIDRLILKNSFNIEDGAIENAIAELRIDLGADFDAVVASAGFTTEESLFEFFETILLEEEMLSQKLMPSDERLQELFENMGTTVSGSHILVDDEVFALELIELLNEADDFETTFADLAREYSNCPSGASGGDLGTWSIGQMVPEFDEAVLELEVGDFTLIPVETQFGFHIIFKTGGAQTFEQAREDLIASEILNQQRTPGVVEAIYRDLRQSANIQFTHPVLQSQFDAFN